MLGTVRPEAWRTRGAVVREVRVGDMGCASAAADSMAGVDVDASDGCRLMLTMLGTVRRSEGRWRSSSKDSVLSIDARGAYRVGGRRSWLGYTCVATLVDSVRVGHGADLAGVGGGGDSIDTALMLEASDVSAAEYVYGADGAT